jgi:tRNA A37 N6-isopentenylltransferase MiaA
VTVVFPHDISWAAAEPATAAVNGLATAAAAQLDLGSSSQQQQQQQRRRLAESPAACQFLKDCAAALRAAPRGKVALLLGGTALLDEGAVKPWSNAGQTLGEPLERMHATCTSQRVL